MRADLRGRRYAAGRKTLQMCGQMGQQDIIAGNIETPGFVNAEVTQDKVKNSSHAEPTHCEAQCCRSIKTSLIV
jgi:hypothetical protein